MNTKAARKPSAKQKRIRDIADAIQYYYEKGIVDPKISQLSLRVVEAPIETAGAVFDTDLLQELANGLKAKVSAYLIDACKLASSNMDRLPFVVVNARYYTKHKLPKDHEAALLYISREGASGKAAGVRFTTPGEADPYFIISIQHKAEVGTTRVDNIKTQVVEGVRRKALPKQLAQDLPALSFL